MPSSIMRLVTAACVLVLLSLACRGPFAGGDDPEESDPSFNPSPPSYVGDVAVKPQKGSGEFAASISYFWKLGDKFAISCSYPGPDGKTISSDPPVTQTGGSTELRFTVTKPGSYSITCAAPGYGSSSALFEVIEAEPGSGEPGPAGSPETKAFTQAALDLRTDTIVATRGDTINIFTCSPSNFADSPDTSFTVSADGVLDGRCLSVPYDYQPTQGVLAGQWNRETGEVTFQLTINTTVNPDAEKQAHWVVLIDGAGKFTSENTAEGSATWSNTCDAHPDVSCYDLTTHKEAGGKLQWRIEFRE